MDNKNIYTFNKGNGQVTIFDNSGYDTLIFGNSIVQADLEKYIFGNDLVVAIKDTNDKITIKNWFVNSNKFKIEEFKIITLVIFNQCFVLLTTKYHAR